MTRDDLKNEFIRLAEWRRRQAEQQPNDHRDAQAAMVLERLAASVEELKDNDFESSQELLDADSELLYRMLMGVGFGWWPKSAEEFVDALIANQRTKPRQS